MKAGQLTDIMKLLHLIGFALMMLAGLFFIAGSPTIQFMPRNVANFAGLACGAIGVVVWAASRIKRG